MIHCIVSYRKIDTSSSGGHAPLVVILYVSSEVYNVLVHDFHGLKTCMLLDEVFFNNWRYLVLCINISLSLYIWYISYISLYGFSITLNIDSLHNLGTLFSVKHLLSISSSQLCKVGHRLFICFTSI